MKKIIGKIWSKTPRPVRLGAIRISQKKFTSSVAAIIVNEEKEILLLDHVLRATSNWGIPGGFLEHFEQPEKAIEREIKEETGLDLEDVTLYSVRTINRHLEILFLAKPKGTAEVKSSEINRIGWFTVDNLPKDMSTVQKAIVREIMAELEEHNSADLIPS